MLIAGDFDLMRVILDYYTNMAKLLGPRTQAYWGHPGVWTTETQQVRSTSNHPPARPHARL
jgi:hypothetical protein